MTEHELNMNLAQIECQRLALLPASVPARCANYRRTMHIRKNDRLMKIVTRHYVPHAGYIEFGFEGKTLFRTGKYIKFPQNSNCQQWIKRQTSRKMRNCHIAPAKGNFYRRLFDYWWTLY